MKHLESFFNYILESTESNDFSKEYLQELLVPISDLGVKVHINDRNGLIKTVTKGEFVGRGYITISFNLSDLENINGDVFGGYRRMISDNKFWDFLDEFIAFKNRLETDKIAVYFNTSSGDHLYPYFGISFLVPGDYKSDTFELEKVYDIIRRRINRGSSDFFNSTTIELDKENKLIRINCSGFYTDRKFNILMRDIDRTLLNIEKTVVGGVVKIEITLK